MLKDEYYRDLKRKNIVRLFLTYVLPIILLTAFFCFQYDAIVSHGRTLHLKAVAENQANTLDLFLSERLVNLSNLIDDPRFAVPPTSQMLSGHLDKLRKSSETFVDLGFFDSSGVQTAYAGPFPTLEKRNYSSEAWYQSLRAREDNHIITDIYLGFRQQPHFTIAVSRAIDRQFVVLRATLDPKKIYDYISGVEGSQEVYTSIVNEAGLYQVVTPRIGTPLERAAIVPPREPRLGAERASIEGEAVRYAYSWLRGADWALMVQSASEPRIAIFSGFGLRLIGISAAVVVLVMMIILSRADRLVRMQMESDRARVQLEHAAKLASVGELAAGIAHEINNPLAAISEEAGLMKDLMSDQFGQSITPQEVMTRLDSIQESVFRCRNITQKLLRWVRRTDFDLRPHDVHKLINEVVDDLLGPEMEVSNIEIVREYDKDLPQVNVDGNQFQQVLINLLNNAVDAIGDKAGCIRIVTWERGGQVHIVVNDSGRGMTAEQLDKIFLPFYTTKEVGEGTGLGLSVSYGITKHMGGKIEVESKPGQGSTFTLVLPVPKQATAP